MEMRHHDAIFGNAVHVSGSLLSYFYCIPCLDRKEGQDDSRGMVHNRRAERKM